MESSRPQPLQDGYVKVTVRDRVSADGGQSILPSHQFTSTMSRSQVPVVQFERFKGENVPAPGSLAKARIKFQHPSVKNTTGAPSTNGVAPRTQAVVNGVPLSRVSSNSSTGQKRQRLGVDGASDSDEEVQEWRSSVHPSPSPSPAPPPAPPTQAVDATALPFKVFLGRTPTIIYESTLRKYMYNMIDARWRDRLPRDPSGCLSQCLREISLQIGLPENYLLDNPLCQGCQEWNAKEMLKNVFKNYYDEQMVPTEERGNVRWLL